MSYKQRLGIAMILFSFFAPYIANSLENFGLQMFLSAVFVGGCILFVFEEDDNAD